MRLSIFVLVLPLTACDMAKDALVEKATEVALEAATGEEVDIDGKTVTVKDAEGNTVKTTRDEDGKVVIEGKDGRAVIGGTEIPENFPLPVMDGLKAETSMSGDQEGKQQFMVAFSTDLEVKAVADFYEKALKEKGLKVRRVQMSDKGKEAIMLAGEKKPKTEAAVYIGRDAGKEKTKLSIQWTSKP